MLTHWNGTGQNRNHFRKHGTGQDPVPFDPTQRYRIDPVRCPKQTFVSRMPYGERYVDYPPIYTVKRCHG